MYLVDANVLIEAKNRYYAFDLAPGFWDWIDHAHQQNLVCSIDAVYTELTVGTDALATWAERRPTFFRPIDEATTRHFAPLTQWATSTGFTPAALSKFTGDNTDYLLIAYAREHDHVVVTHEISQPTARKRVLIPDACHAMGVHTVNTFDMLRASGARFGLQLPA
ncbi:DUF4411 family protein [Gordonia phthalatica]|uniref:Twitching motility protein PilT n=1 Tax=Gordonia phthalatica TaxID=1136941 RepID=A0A0N9MS46_9ACTN|nr:DUF4411 family protein [Gordonia phthalatica]ALG85900.1 hypothetical protein ACH46_17170 [Gordonia phthalatica]